MSISYSFPKCTYLNCHYCFASFGPYPMSMLESVNSYLHYIMFYILHHIRTVSFSILDINILNRPNAVRAVLQQSHIFSKIIKTLHVSRKQKTSHFDFFFKRSPWYFQISLAYNFVITLKKRKAMYIFAYSTLKQSRKRVGKMLYYFCSTFRTNGFPTICWFFTGQYAHIFKYSNY